MRLAESYVRVACKQTSATHAEQPGHAINEPQAGRCPRHPTAAPAGSGLGDSTAGTWACNPEAGSRLARCLRLVSPVSYPTVSLLPSHANQVPLPEDLEDLVNFRITREQRRALHRHLRKDAPDRPHINPRRVVTRAQQYFRRAVPQRYDLPTNKDINHRLQNRTGNHNFTSWV